MIEIKYKKGVCQIDSVSCNSGTLDFSPSKESYVKFLNNG